MLKKIKIGSKITVLVLIVVLIAVAVMSFIAYDLNKRLIGERHAENLKVIVKLRTQKIQTIFEQTQLYLQLVQQSPSLQKYLLTLENTPESASHIETEKELDATLKSFKDTYGFQNLYLADGNGKIVYKVAKEVGESQGGTYKIAGGVVLDVEKVKGPFYQSKIYEREKEFFLFIAVPVINTDGTHTGLVIGEINMQPVFTLLQDTIGLGKTGEVILGEKVGNKIVYLNPLRHKSEADVKVNVEGKAMLDTSLEEAINGKEGIGEVDDYRNKQVIAAWEPIPSIKLGAIAKIDAAEVYEPINSLRYQFLLAGLVVLFGALAVSAIFSHFLTHPMLSLKANMRLLGEGILPKRLDISSNDEIGEMIETVNTLVEGLKKTASFAHKIGDGNFDADFKPMSQNDTLGLALLNMRDSIQDSAKRDDEQNWIVTGVAEIGDILRTTNNLDELGERVVSYITKKIDAIQGAFYVVNDEDENNKFIEMTASYAYHKKKYLQGKFKFAEGLVGQAAIEQDTILRTEVPDSYVTITSGLLGDRKPTCILIVPLTTVIGSERVVYGVLEFAGFEKFSSRNVRFVNEISEIIARTIFNIKVNETTRLLLEKSQKQSEELQEQQEVLRQNAEEMQATQEELKRTNYALEEQIEQVNRAQKRMQVLLENASEVITIYEADRKIRYISPSIEKILGYKQEELIGINDIVYVQEESVELVEQMFQELIESPGKKVMVQFSYKRKNGDWVWLEATGNNLLADSAIEGIVINSRDITERRRAEREERMRGQMQALSENSPDLITRLNKEGKVFYINPVIETYTGLHKEEYLRRSIEEVQLNEVIVNSWNTILQNVLTNGETIATEMDFPSILGDRVMQVNAIPEYNEEKAIESVLVVSHDITDRKMIELEVQTKNKKITESINYAKRIQEAILPDNSYVQHAFPDAFILYKPRDVVSGDFPWFLQKGDDLYIAAVDCTGHGVPGALISLIGYFLLNSIVGNKDIAEPGEILDHLDIGVTQTLKQDNLDASTRDGMDIALCRVNLKTKTIHFSGAHRPLFYFHNGELSEVKGDKFPIGGGQYKGRSNFATTKLDISPGDAIYFCSDGLPDQFGGPDNRKFSMKKIREIIVNNAALSMEEQRNIFESEFDSWKGGNKQTDDVLMIGIKF